MSYLAKLDITPEQKSAIDANPTIKAFLDTDNEATWNHLAAANQLPDPLDDYMSIRSAGTHRTRARQVNLVEFCARLGLEKHFTYLYQSASGFQKQVIFDVSNSKSPFHTACSGGQLDIIEAMITLAPEKVRSLVEAKSFTALQEACANGHLAVIERLLFLVSDKSINFIKAGFNKAYRKAYTNGHLAVAERLIEFISVVAPDKTSRLVKAISLQSFGQACANGHLAVVERLIRLLSELAPEKLKTFVVEKYFMALCLACENGYLEIFERLFSLISELAPDRLFAAVEKIKSIGFTMACGSGNLYLVERLISLVSESSSDNLLEMVKASGSFALESACGNGHVHIFERLMTLFSNISPETLSNIIESSFNECFLAACKNGHLAVVERLITLAPEKALALTAMNHRWRFEDPFAAACRSGNIDVVERLIAFLSDKIIPKIEASKFSSFRWAYVNGHVAILDKLIELVSELAPDKLLKMLESCLNSDSFPYIFENVGTLESINKVNKLVSILAPEKIRSLDDSRLIESFHRACLMGQKANAESLVTLVTDITPDKVKLLVEAKNFYAFRAACEAGDLDLVEYLIALTPQQLTQMTSSGRGYYLRQTVNSGHIAVIKRLLQLAPTAVLNALETDNFGCFKLPFSYNHYQTTYPLLQNEAILRSAVENLPQSNEVIDNFVNLKLAALKAEKMAFQAENPSTRFDISANKTSSYVSILGYLMGSKYTPERQANIDLLMSLPALNPLPQERYQWCLDKAIDANNAKIALRLLVSSPQADSPLNFLPIQNDNTGEPFTLRKNLHLLRTKTPDNYERLLHAFRLNSAIDSSVYNVLSKETFTDTDLLWKAMGQPVNFQMRRSVLLAFTQNRPKFNKSTPSSRAKRKVITKNPCM